MIKDSEIKAIIYLLDDPDEEVIHSVEQRLYNEGPEIVPILEEYWSENEDPVKANRLENIIRNIHNNQLGSDFKDWINNENRELLKGSELVCRIQYPGMDPDALNDYIEKVRLDAWMALYSAPNPIDRVQILNHILFDRQGIIGNTTNYHAPENSFLNRVIETRTGNPISLCILYSIIAQRLGLPIFGVNLPQHFVLAYCEDSENVDSNSFHSQGELNRSDFGKELFYINPFSKGQIFLKRNIDEFLKAIKVEERESFYTTCSNLDIIRRVLRNLHFSYMENHNHTMVNSVARFMQILGMEAGGSYETPGQEF